MKGTPFIKYGDELNYDDQSGDIMKWDDSIPSCGFSTGNKTIKNCAPNVLEENSHGSDLTSLKFLRKLISIRSSSNSQSFQWGDINLANTEDKSIVAFSREAKGFQGYLVAANLGDQSVRHDYNKTVGIPDDGEVVYYNSQSTELAEGKPVHTHNLLIKPYSFLIVKYDREPKKQEDKPASGMGH